jgi:hypothetical protein
MILEQIDELIYEMDPVTILGLFMMAGGAVIMGVGVGGLLVHKKWQKQFGAEYKNIMDWSQATSKFVKTSNNEILKGAIKECDKEYRKITNNGSDNVIQGQIGMMKKIIPLAKKHGAGDDVVKDGQELIKRLGKLKK